MSKFDWEKANRRDKQRRNSVESDAKPSKSGWVKQGKDNKFFYAFVWDFQTFYCYGFVTRSQAQEALDRTLAKLP